MICSLNREQGMSNNGVKAIFDGNVKKQSFFSLMLASSILFFPSISYSYQNSELISPPEIVSEKSNNSDALDFADSDFDNKMMDMSDDLLAVEEEYQPEAGIPDVELEEISASINSEDKVKILEVQNIAEENPEQENIQRIEATTDIVASSEDNIVSEKTESTEGSKNGDSFELPIVENNKNVIESVDDTEISVAENVDEELPELPDLPELNELPDMEVIEVGDNLSKGVSTKSSQKSVISSDDLKTKSNIKTGGLDIKKINPDGDYRLSPEISKESLVEIKEVESLERKKIDSAQEEYEKEIERINAEYSKKMEILDKLDKVEENKKANDKLSKYNNKPKLSEEVVEVLEKIPANKIVKEKSMIEPVENVNINRSNSNPALPEFLDEDIKSNNRPDVGIKLHSQDKENKVFDNIGKAYEAMESGDNDIAIAYYKMALSQDEKNFEARFGLATIYQMMQRFDQAKEIYLDLLEEDQSNWDVLNNFLVLAGQEASDDAIKQLQKLEISNPEFAPLPEQLGLIYTDRKQYKKAIRKLVRAVKLDPENNQYRYNLALVLEHVKDLESAGKIYQQLLYAARRGKKLPVPATVIQRKIDNIAAKLIHK